jgi:anti-anti-sigma regulatory factor
MKDTLVYSQIATLAPHGYISAANVNRFQQELTQAVVSKEYSLLLVDMKEVEFLFVSLNS